MKVVATNLGQYNQILREKGEVFELLSNPDGTYPVMFKREFETVDGVRRLKKIPLYILDAEGKPKLKNGKPVPEHRDFAEDMGNILIEEGPKAGESMQVGWMQRVPDHVPCGLYPEGVDFWSGAQLPQAFTRQVGQQDRRAAPIRAHA